jgi:hypothetical protein
MPSSNPSVASVENKGLAPTPSAVCTRVCTSEPENANAGTLHTDQGSEGEGTAGGSSTADQADPLAKLAAALLDLMPADRARLAAMLTGHQGEGKVGA